MKKYIIYGIIALALVGFLSLRGCLTMPFIDLPDPFDGGKYDSRKGSCGDDSVGGLSEKAACLEQQIKYCASNGGGQNTACYTDRGIKSCDGNDNNCVANGVSNQPCPCYPDSIPCGDFGNFSSRFGPCGSNQQGGKKCFADCAAAQVAYCKGIQGGGQNKDCYLERGIPECKNDSDVNCWPNILSCADFGTFDSKYGKCGSNQQGGKKCFADCAAAQVAYCKGIQGGGQNKDCYLERGIPECKSDTDVNCWPNILSCADFGTFDSKYGKCGNARQGGTKCYADCIQPQLEYCKRHGGGQNQKCYTDRGVRVCKNGSDTNCWPNSLSEADFGIFSVDRNGPAEQKCGGHKQGGAKYKAACCRKQKAYCDRNWGGTKCRNERGCS